MGTDTKIQWADHTFNPWRGCTKVSAECDHCYAEATANWRGARFGVWGKHGSRFVTSEAMWKEPAKWNNVALMNGKRARVFCASLADVFESGRSMPEDAWKPVAEARTRLFDLIRHTPWLDWLLLTKRPENVMSLVPSHWKETCSPTPKAIDRFPVNVWLGTSVGVQKTKERIDVLRRIPAKIRFISMEPLLEDLGELDLTGIHWVIIGGESGPGARPCDIRWIENVIDQCRDQNVSVFVKQLGAGRRDYEKVRLQPWSSGLPEAAGSWSYSDPKGGDINEFPTHLKIRQLPEVTQMREDAVEERADYDAEVINFAFAIFGDQISIGQQIALLRFIDARRDQPREARLAEAEEMPLCPGHRSLDKSDDLVLHYGNDCVACSLNERNELLEILAEAVPDTKMDSVTALRKFTTMADWQWGDVLAELTALRTENEKLREQVSKADGSGGQGKWR